MSASINITALNTTQNSIDWSWNTGLTVTSISIDGNKIITADNSSSEYILNDLQPNSKHIIKVYTSTDSGSNTTYTQSANDDLSNLIALIYKWFWPLIVPLCIFCIAIYLKAEFLAFIVTIISCANIIIIMAGSPVIWGDAVINVIVLITSLFIGFVGIDS
jgi:hypothetical protein